MSQTPAEILRNLALFPVMTGLLDARESRDVLRALVEDDDLWAAVPAVVRGSADALPGVIAGAQLAVHGGPRAKKGLVD